MVVVSECVNSEKESKTAYPDFWPREVSFLPADQPYLIVNMMQNGQEREGKMGKEEEKERDKCQGEWPLLVGTHQLTHDPCAPGDKHSNWRDGEKSRFNLAELRLAAQEFNCFNRSFVPSPSCSSCAPLLLFIAFLN